MNKILGVFWYHATQESMGDWGLTGWGWLVVVCLIIGLIIWIIDCCEYVSKKKSEEQYRKIRLLGYKDIDDIRIFLKGIGAHLDDFILSKGIRKQYELFSEGKSSDFIKIAENNKKIDEKSSAASAKGFATGLILGSAISHNTNT